MRARWAVACVWTLLLALHVSAHVERSKASLLPEAFESNTVVEFKRAGPRPFRVLQAEEFSYVAASPSDDADSSHALVPPGHYSELEVESKQGVGLIDIAGATIASWALQAAAIAVELMRDRHVKTTMNEIGALSKEAGEHFDAELLAFDRIVKKMKKSVETSQKYAAKVNQLLDQPAIRKLYPEFIKVKDEEMSKWLQSKNNKNHPAQLKNPLYVPFSKLKHQVEYIATVKVMKEQPADPLGSQLYELQRLTSRMHRVADKAAQLAAAQPDTTDEHPWRRLFLDATVGKLRPRAIAKELIKAGLGYLASIVTNVFTSYVGVVWNAMQLVTSVYELHQTKKVCAEMVEDYKTMGEQLIEDIQYTNCRALTSVQLHMLLEIASVQRLFADVKSTIPTVPAQSAAAGNTVTEAFDSIEQLLTELNTMWTDNADINSKCKKFLEAKPAAFDAQFATGLMEYQGLLEAKRTGSMFSQRFCFIPPGVGYLQCHKVTAEQATEWTDYLTAKGKIGSDYTACIDAGTSRACTEEYQQCLESHNKPTCERRRKECHVKYCKTKKAKAAGRVHKLYASTVRKWITPMLNGASDINVRLSEVAEIDVAAVRADTHTLELKYPEFFRRNVHLKSETAGVILTWAKHIKQVQTRMGHTSSNEKAIHSLYSVTAAGIGFQDLVEPFQREARKSESNRVISLRTEYADSMYSILPGKKSLTPDKPDWQDATETKLVFQKYKTVDPEGYSEAPMDRAISSIIVVPVGDLENSGLKEKTIHTPFAGPFDRTQYSFVGSASNPVSTKPENFVISSQVVIKGLIKDMTVEPTHALYMAFSIFAGAPISALATFPKGEAPEQWRRVGYMLEYDKKSPPACYRTRLGQTEMVQEDLYVLRDYRVTTLAALQARVDARVAAWTDALHSEVENINTENHAAKSAYRKWLREKQRREAELKAKEEAARQAALKGKGSSKASAVPKVEVPDVDPLEVAEDELNRKRIALNNQLFKITITPVAYTNLPADTRNLGTSVFLKFLQASYSGQTESLGSETVQAGETDTFPVPSVDDATHHSSEHINPAVPPVVITSTLTSDITVQTVDWGFWSNSVLATHRARFIDMLQQYRTAIPLIAAQDQVVDVSQVNGKTIVSKMDITKSLVANGYKAHGRERTTVSLALSFEMGERRVRFVAGPDVVKEQADDF